MKSLAWALGAAVALGLSSGVALAAETTLRISLQLPLKSHLGQNLLLFKEEVEKNSNGEIAVEIYDSAQLYKDKEVPAAVGSGAIEMGVASLTRYVGDIPAVDIFYQPFLFDTEEKVRAAVAPGSPVRAPLDEAIKDTGSTVLWWQAYGGAIMGLPDGQKVLMAKIGAAHGIRGEVRVKPFGDDPLSFTDYGVLTTKDGNRSFEVEKARVQKTVVITKFREITDRNQAEDLNGLELFVDRDQLPDPEDDEFYYSDLNGLTVLDQTGEQLGKIVAVQDFGAGDLLEVRPKRGRTFYIPFTKDFVPEVSLAESFVKVDLPEDYFSEEKPEPSEASPER